MHVLGGDELAHQWMRRAGEYLHLRVAGEFADLAGILFGKGKRHVACDGGDAQDLDLRTCKGQQYGDGVVLTRVRVDDDFHAVGHFISLDKS